MSQEIYNLISILLTLLIGFFTIWFAKSQADSASKQVEIAKTTNNETKKLLEDIKKTVEKVEIISNRTKEDIQKQVDKLIDNQNEHQKSLMVSLTNILSNFDPKVKQNDASSQMVAQIFSQALTSGNPESMKMLMEMSKLGMQNNQSKNN